MVCRPPGYSLGAVELLSTFINYLASGRLSTIFLSMIYRQTLQILLSPNMIAGGVTHPTELYEYSALATHEPMREEGNSQFLPCTHTVPKTCTKGVYFQNYINKSASPSMSRRHASAFVTELSVPKHFTQKHTS